MRRTCTYCILLSVYLLFFTHQSYGVTVCVSTDTQLSLALYYAALSDEDDVVHLVQGTYHGGFEYASANNSNLIIEGGYTEACADRVQDRTNTVLDGGASDRVLALSSSNSADFSLDSLTIQNGSYTSLGGGVFIQTWGGNVSVTSSIFKNNAVNGGGGGGLFVHSINGDGDIYVHGNQFIENDSRGSSSGNGGGAYIDSDGGIATVTSNEFIQNQGGSGGGLSISGLETIISNNTFNANDGLTDRGGGIYVSGTKTLIDHNTITNSISGGGINIGNSISTISNNIILNNTDGPGITFSILGSSSKVTIVNNIIAGNSAYSSSRAGGVNTGLVSNGAILTLTNNTISGNHGPGDGGGLKISAAENDGHIYINSNIIWGNTANGEGNDIYINDDYELDNYHTPIHMFANDFDQSEHGFYIENPVFVLLLDSSNIDNKDPFFVSGGSDYHLNAGSPCINTGNNLAPEITLTDLEGEARIKAGIVDMGAYESPGPILPAAVFDANPLNGPIPLTVNFSDHSLGSVTAWSWDFGDGGTSTEQNPTHTYLTGGAYTVSLIVTGTEGSTTEIKNGYIVVALAPPVAVAGSDRAISQFDITLDGSGSSDVDGNIVSYEWKLNYRDDVAYNQTATGVSPVIKDLHSGFYDVQLVVTDEDGLTSVDTMLLAVSEPWDVNNDQTLGLEEVIYILRILSGNN